MTPLPRVLVDATAIPRDRGGVGRYLEHLLPALDADGLKLIIVAQERDRGWLSTSVPGARIILPGSSVSGLARRLAWEQFGLPGLARREAADVIFSPHYTMPVFARVPVVVTLHDATFFSHPELHGRVKRFFFRQWTRYSLRHAAATIVPSEATASELVRLARARPGSSNVVHHGVDTALFRAPSAASVDDIASRIGSRHWLAFLGTIEPRKNVGSLVAAFATIVANTRVATDYPDLRLCLAGSMGWDHSVQAAIDGSAVHDRIVRLGFVPDSELAGLLGGAAVVVYPSLGEGFGLPVLEAMASGAPVVTTRLLSLPEVGGDVAVYSEPDSDSIAAAIIDLLCDPGERRSRGRKGIQRAKRFSWAASAAGHIRVFQSVAVSR